MKRLFTPLSIFYLLACFILISCHDTQTVIKGCCDEPPVSEQVGVGWVWVPNVFTPNGDGWHDWMVIYGDSIRQIIKLEIRNKQNFEVFSGSHILLIDHANVWGGQVRGRVEKGLYSYTLKVEAIDLTVKTIEGHICNCPCDQAGDEDFNPVSNCEFGLCDPHYIDCDEREYLPCFKY